ncbi:iron-sulfur cluster carrier protein ApbC [Catenovulum sediminis]|uniref:Iron-sulfur cluster carrier protein n=1 Tax=Catenovulum sediminis TaxID=1740262 RepID=A0ABV1RLH0_9ALTE
MFKNLFGQKSDVSGKHQSKPQAKMNVQYSDVLAKFCAQYDVPNLTELVKIEDEQVRLPFKLELLEDELKSINHNLSIQYDYALATLNRSHQNPRAQIKHIIAVASGKGGVGKSTVSVNLARALKQLGADVGVLDADIYGPSIPLMLGLAGQQPEAIDDKWMKPLVSKEGIKTISIGYLVDPKKAAIWRGPMASKALTQLFNETVWGELDYLIIDLPPGTGDIQLTLMQSMPLSTSIVVTTPQNIALADAEKALAMFNELKIPVAGIVENMSVHTCSQCGHQEAIFGEKGGQSLAVGHHTKLLASLPLDIKIRETMDKGDGSGFNSADLFAGYRNIAIKLATSLYLQARNNPAQQSIPVTQVD